MFREHRGSGKLNHEEKGAIIAYTDAGWSQNRIANRLGITESTVYYWQKRFEETGDVCRKIGSGRQRKTTLPEDERIRDAVAAKPITTRQEIAGLFFKYIFFKVFQT